MEHLNNLDRANIITQNVDNVRELNFGANDNIGTLDYLSCKHMLHTKNFEELDISLATFTNKFYLIFLLETCKIDNLNLFKIDGYRIYYKSEINKSDGMSFFSSTFIWTLFYLLYL